MDCDNKTFYIVLPNDRLGGAERVALNLAKHISSNEHVFKLVVYFMYGGRSGTWNDLENKKNVTLVYNEFKSEKSSLFKMAVFFSKIKKIDYIYSTHVHVNAFVCLLYRMKIIPKCRVILRESTVVSERFSGIKAILFSFLYQFYGVHDLLICQTGFMREKLIFSRSERISKNAQVIGNPINFQEIQRKSLESDGISENSLFKIAIVGRLVDVKNHILFFNALELLPSGLKSNIEVNVIGSGPLKNKLEEYIENKSLINFCFFHGNVSNPYKFMKKMDLGVLTSKHEGFPNVILEMMASGTKNIITTPCTEGLRDIEGINVLYGFSELELTEALISAIQIPQSNVQAYRKYVQSRSVERYFEQIINLVG